MGYWFIVFFLFAMLVLSLFLAYSFKKKENKKDFVLSVISVLSYLVLSTYFGIDIPCALRGGSKIYIDEPPAVISMRFFNIVEADGHKFISLDTYNPADYPNDVTYCITYTDFSKTVLKTEKIKTSTN